MKNNQAVHTEKEPKENPNQSGNGLPVWFGNSCNIDNVAGDSQSIVQLLNAVRSEAHSSLSLYQVTVKYATTLILSLITVVGVLFSFVKSSQNMSPSVLVLAERGGSIVLLIAACIGGVSVLVITRYYNVYVSTLLFAAQLHYAAGLDGYHWFERIIDLLRCADQSITRKEFIGRRTWSKSDSHYWYAVFLGVLSASCLAGSILIWLTHPLGVG